MTNQTFVYIPYWVETALNRNSLGFDTCLDYSKLRQILSLEDMSGLLAIQDIKSLTREESSNNTGTLFSMWNKSVSDTQRAELTQAIVPMSRSTELKIDILKRLELQESYPETLTSTTDQPVEPLFYKFVDITGSVHAIVIYKGFRSYVCNLDNEYSFVVDKLKRLYIYLKTYQVSSSSEFKKYLRLLAGKVNVG